MRTAAKILRGRFAFRRSKRADGREKGPKALLMTVRLAARSADFELCDAAAVPVMADDDDANAIHIVEVECVVGRR